jgi:hypothetical protein
MALIRLSTLEIFIFLSFFAAAAEMWLARLLSVSAANGGRQRLDYFTPLSAYSTSPGVQMVRLADEIG